MFKKITSKLKALFGKGSKKIELNPEITIKENKTQQPIKGKKENYSNKKQIYKKSRNPREPHPQSREKVKDLNNQKNINPLVIPEKTILSEPWDSSVFKAPVIDGKTRFQDLNLRDELLHAIYDLDFKYCTDVQAETLPKSLLGEDLTAQAQTGTGKTAAFLLSMFNHILNNPFEKRRKYGTPRALILAPTRELVMQIEKDSRSLGKYADLSILSLIGGIDYGKQQHILRKSEIDVLICTPGRLIDFMDKRIVDLSKIEILVIDEADRMLNMGFIPDVKKIVRNTPQKAKRQTMFFTATMSTDVRNLAESWTKLAHNVSITPDEMAVQNIEQITYITTVDEKLTLLYNLITQKNLERVLIFVNRRDEAKKLKDTFEALKIKSVLLTGDIEQRQRISRLESFRNGDVRVLVATDVASRGIHVEAISHVINYNLPQDVEEYIHRIGRTGRAGAAGISINFADEEDSYELPKLEEFLGNKIDCIFPEESLLAEIPKYEIKKVPSQYNKKKTYKKNYKPRNT